jgi:hypothetical protein
MKNVSNSDIMSPKVTTHSGMGAGGSSSTAMKATYWMTGRRTLMPPAGGHEYWEPRRY